MADPLVELKENIENIGTAFEEFKSTNDQRIEKMAKGESVVDLEAKLAKIDKDMSQLDELKADIEELAKITQRGATSDVDPDQQDHKDAFGQFMRKGVDDGLSEIQQKATQIGVDADGGYAVPQELDRNIGQMERDGSPMRQVADVITVSNEQYQKLFSTGSAASGWVGETDDRDETGTPKLVKIAPSFGEIYANPATTQRALDDMFFDVEGWLSGEVSREFAEKENIAYTSGNGTNKPKGFLAGTINADADSARDFGALQFVNSGAAAAFTGDGLIDLVYSLKQGYRQGAMFMTSRLALAELRKLKDNEDNYLWQPGLSAGQPQQILSHGIVENEDMPEMAADAYSLAFGDFKRGYKIVDIVGVRVLRDPYTHKPYVHFYTTKRTGGMLEDSQAIKIQKIAA